MSALRYLSFSYPPLAGRGRGEGQEKAGNESIDRTMLLCRTFSKSLRRKTSITSETDVTSARKSVARARAQIGHCLEEGVTVAKIFIIIY